MGPAILSFLYQSLHVASHLVKDKNDNYDLLVQIIGCVTLLEVWYLNMWGQKVLTETMY